MATYPISITPPYLKKGDKVAFVAPARSVIAEEIAIAGNQFEQWGLEVVSGENIYHVHHQFAGTDEERVHDLQWALDDVEIKAIICVKGGYGTSRILDRLDFSNFAKAPKWIVGFSDITFLLIHIRQFNIESIHGVMPSLFSKPNAGLSIESLKDVLFGRTIKYNIPSHPLNIMGNAEGKLIGGNLSIIHTLIGTHSDTYFTDKILFIEDVDEYLYHIDRMMGQMHRAEKLKRLKGVIVGSFTKMKDNPVPFGMDSYEIILSYLKPLSIPICFGFPVGHSFDNKALIIGRIVNLSVSVSNCVLGFS